MFDLMFLMPHSDDVAFELAKAILQNIDPYDLISRGDY